MDLKLDLRAILDPFSPQNLIEPSVEEPPGILEGAYGPTFLSMLQDELQREPTKFSPVEQSAIVSGKVPNTLQYSILEKLERSAPRAPQTPSFVTRHRSTPKKPLGEAAFVPATGPSLHLESAPRRRLPAALRDLLLPQRGPGASRE